MNKTKKLTQGAMMLAILGALIILDRLTAYWFTEFVVLIAPIIIIMYSCMQTFRDGLLLSIGVVIISFLLGNFQMLYLIYIPVGVVTGLVYSYGIKKGFDKSTLLLLACTSYALGELIASYVVYPILGIPVSQMIDELKMSLGGGDLSVMGIDYTQVFSAAGFDMTKLLVIMFFISTVLMGVLEGLLIHILSVFLLKRFKVKDLGNINLWEVKPNKVVAYVSFLSLFAFAFKNYMKNEYVYYIVLSIAVIGAIILLYYGYLFITLYSALVLRRNMGLIFVFLCLFVPIFLVILIVIGFLYGSGPLRTYLENKVKEIKHE